MVSNRLASVRLVANRASVAVTVLLIACLPLTGSITANALDCTPVDHGPGTHRPVGSDAATYTYNCGTDKWENEHFIYDPATALTTPKDTIYTYNAATGAYDYTVWLYSAPSGDYFPVVKSTQSPPSGATVIGAPRPKANSINGTGAGSNNTVNNNGGSGGNSINNTGDNSNNTVNADGTSNTSADNDTTLGVSNLLTGTSASGDALVVANTVAGGASSGDAQSMANVLNMLQSTSNSLGGDMVTFVANIDGDVNGDLILDPNMLGADVQPASGSNNLTFNNEVDASINNDINLTATSGDATVDANTTGGDATTGNAKVVANIVNIINSAVTSGKSFLGVININGNLNGDILLPPDFIDQLLAANVPTVNIITDTGAGSNNTINNDHSSTTNVNNSNDLGITNNVTADATSGDATVEANTNAGGATSGSAKSTITAFNLTGSQVIGSNAILVFVNVTGTWVGLIVNAPPGSTAAGLGGNIVSNTGSGSNNTVNANGSNNTDIDNDVTHRITNDVNVNARSGDATVTRNTNAGSARSGDADVAVNLLNVENSTLSLKGWFGILFINVFGTWNGSFGINTSAGNPVAAAAGGMGGSAAAPFAQFVPGGVGDANKTTIPRTFGSTTFYGGSGGGQSTTADTDQSSVAAIGSTKGSGSGSKPSSSAAASGQVRWPLVAGSTFLFGAYIFSERYYDGRRPNFKIETLKPTVTRLITRH